MPKEQAKIEQQPPVDPPNHLDFFFHLIFLLFCIVKRNSKSKLLSFTFVCLIFFFLFLCRSQVFPVSCRGIVTLFCLFFFVLLLLFMPFLLFDSIELTFFCSFSFSQTLYFIRKSVNLKRKLLFFLYFSVDIILLLYSRVLHE